MTVEERNGSMGKDGGLGDQFPVGMRVLAVDDDQTCLKLLEAMLRRCKYHVTTTGQASTAFTLLKENKDKFDLVISDVHNHMPGMDGFKLLEFVGLEMDLPVIMLSANDESKTVMEGITHGACDYLLKPVRIQELRNIWQHVIRRRKFDPRNHNNNEHGEDCEKPDSANSEGGKGPIKSESSGQLTRKRKDHNVEEDDDCEENMHENEDPSTQKRPRVVWSVDLHRKFVDAVNQLGIDKAVPKRILDLMNVEMLTRGNVASHLQKYRLYLKRLSAVVSQHAKTVAALGGSDRPYLPMGSFDGFGNFHALTGSGQLPALTSSQAGGMLGRINRPAGLGFYGLPSSEIVQLGHIHNNMRDPINDLGQHQCTILPGNHRGNLLQGMTTTLDLDQLQQHKTMQETNNRLPGGFCGSGLATEISNNSFDKATNSPMLLPLHQQYTQYGGLGNHSSLGIPSSSSDPFEIGVGVSSHLLDLGRCNDSWQGALPLTRHSANTLPLGASFAYDDLSPGNIGNKVAPIVSHMGRNHHDASSGGAVVASSLGGNMILKPTGINKNSKFSNFRSIGNFEQRWGEQESGHIRQANIMFSSSLNS